MVRFARLRDEEGLTLVEILVGMAIVVIIMGSIGSALIVGLKTTDRTTERLNERHDAQINAAYLANDVQSADSVALARGGSGYGSTTPLVEFTYEDGRIAPSGWTRSVYSWASVAGCPVGIRPQDVIACGHRVSVPVLGSSVRPHGQGSRPPCRLR